MAKKLRGIAGVLMVLVLVAGLVQGCSLKAPGDSEDDGQSVDGGHEAVTICTAQMNYTYFLDALHEKYPEINVKLVSYKGGNSSGYMKSQLVHGDIPDIYTSNYLQDEKLQQEYLLDLSSYSFVNNYTDVMLDSVDVNGAIYMLPSRYTVAGINYNKTMFEKYGWEVPQSFEELQALVERIETEAPDVTPIMARMSLKGYPFQYLFALGSTEFLGTPAGASWKEDFIDGNAKAVGSLEGSVEYLKEWIDAGYITDYNLDGTDFMSDFYDGKVAMVLGTGTSRWSGTGKTTGESMEVGIMAWPGRNGNHGMLLSTVSRYYGISKTLAESGNEQKLEDALKIIEFISTKEGQEALSTGSSNGVAFPFDDYTVSEDNPLYEVKDYLEKGYTVPIAYEGWEEALLVPMADEITKLIQGKTDVSQVVAAFDEINVEVHNDPGAYSYATLEEDLSQEEAARLSGMAMIDGTGADVALVSLGGITDDGNYLENGTGVQCGIYAGDITEETINIFRPYGTKLAFVNLTGAEIKELVTTGLELCADPATVGSEYTYLSEAVTYYMPYVMTVRNDASLDDNQTYMVVFNAGDYSSQLATTWGERLVLVSSDTTGTVIKSWLEKLPSGKLNRESLKW